MGSGYLVELTNGSERVFLTNQTEVANATLDALFGTGSDPLESPAIEFDAATLRWFISADDLRTNDVLFGASSSSDPIGPWQVDRFTLGGGGLPRDDRLAVDRFAVVVTVDAFSPSGAYQGAEIWAANKTDLLAGGAVPVALVGAPNAATTAIVPATPLSDTAVLYLVDDVPGANLLQVYAETGAPPDFPSLTGPVNLSTPVTLPPNATEPGASLLLGTGDAGVQSAVERSGTIWAASTEGCTPAGDSQERSCLHLWQLSTAPISVEQDFFWSTGAGTYDFTPGVSTSSRGDLVVVFGETSTTLDPSVLVAGQSITGPNETLSSPLLLHEALGPIDPGSGCPNDLCAFGSDFSIAFDPLTSGHFYTVGEFAGRNYTTVAWRTWINPVTALRTFPVMFTESDLPNGTSWSVTVNGAVVTSTAPSIVVDEPNGSYTFLVQSPINGSAGVRYLPDPSSGTFAVNATPTEIELTYAVQYELAAAASPSGAGTVFPTTDWFYAGATVSLSALASPGFRFEAWDGDGFGSYSGGGNPANLTITAPINETAEFWVAATYPVIFTEQGLPAGTNWTATVDGISNGSSGPVIGFNEPNGSYSFVVQSPLGVAPGTEYSATPVDGSFLLSGNGTSPSIEFGGEFELDAAPSVAGAGSVNPAGGWFAAGSSFNLSALAAPGEAFLAWNGTGAGAYSGSANPAEISMLGPITETAEFGPSVTFPVLYSESGLPSGAQWSVTTNGLVSTTGGANLTFNEPNGTYTFSIETSFIDPNGTVYVPDPGFGSFEVRGTAVTEVVAFRAVPAAATHPTPSSGSSPPATVAAWLLGLALAGLFVFAIALTIAIWRRNPPPSPPAVVPPPPPVWDETSV